MKKILFSIFVFFLSIISVNWDSKVFDSSNYWEFEGVIWWDFLYLWNWWWISIISNTWSQIDSDNFTYYDPLDNRYILNKTFINYKDKIGIYREKRYSSDQGWYRVATYIYNSVTKQGEALTLWQFTNSIIKMYYNYNTNEYCFQSWGQDIIVNDNWYTLQGWGGCEWYTFYKDIQNVYKIWEYETFNVFLSLEGVHPIIWEVYNSDLSLFTSFTLLNTTNITNWYYKEKWVGQIYITAFDWVNYNATTYYTWLYSSWWTIYWSGTIVYSGSVISWYNNGAYLIPYSGEQWFPSYTFAFWFPLVYTSDTWYTTYIDLSNDMYINNIQYTPILPIINWWSGGTWTWEITQNEIDDLIDVNFNYDLNNDWEISLWENLLAPFTFIKWIWSLFTQGIVNIYNFVTKFKTLSPNL